jgi:hypothetical protein
VLILGCGGAACEGDRGEAGHGGDSCVAGRDRGEAEDEAEPSGDAGRRLAPGASR